MSSAAFKGRIREIRSISGARLVTVSHRPRSIIEGHKHDWPNLTIHLAGGCIEHFEHRSATLDRPGVVFHPAQSAHADDVLASGLETAGLMFDPAWLGSLPNGERLDRPRAWIGGRSTLAARRLVSAWRSPATSDAILRQVTEEFFQTAEVEEGAPLPSWLDAVDDMLETGTCRTASLARRLGLHPAWLARRYREATGEGIQEAARRVHVERALCAIRSSDAPLAQIAIEAGFCDQPHMNRCFRQVLGTTPFEYRTEHAG